MRPETESLEGLGGQSRKGPCGAMPAWSFVFYCLTTKIGTLGERPLVAQSGLSQSWTRKFEQVDKWSFCLIAAMIAANRRDYEQKTAP